MAHELTIRVGGEVEFAANVERGLPWHGLGQRVDHDMTLWEAYQKARLDWTVEQRELLFPGTDGFETVPDRVGNVRSDTGTYLGTVGKNWTPIQNHEACEFVEALVGEGAAVVDCCGSIREGRRVFWTIKVPGDMIVGEDRIDQYMIVSNGHDGSLAFRLFWSPVRVVCSNTLALSLGKRRNEDGIALRHTPNIATRIEEARRALALTTVHYETLAEQFDRLVRAPITDSEVSEYFAALVPDNSKAANNSRTANIRTQLAVNYHSPREGHVRGTWWGVYNAVAEYASHQMTVRNATEENRQESRFNSVLFGSARKLQQDAFDRALVAAVAA